jgi:hypothetical protein
MGNDPLQAKLAEVEAEIRSLEIEWLVALRSDGTKAHRKSGSHDNVQLSQADVARIRGCVVTHNHPGGKSFSEEDIALACGAELLEIRAVTQWWTFRMRPPPGGWNGDTWTKTLEPMFAYAYMTTKDEIERQVGRGGMEDLDPDWEFWSELWKQVAGQSGLEYDEEPFHEPQ